MEALDYKKAYKALYQPKSQPGIIDVPKISFVAVKGQGDPNEEDGAYARALSVLYGISFTVKMSYKGARDIEGYFPYVVPPLEGLWWMPDGESGIDYSRKSDFCWISMIRLPEFVDQEIFDWAKEAAAKKKKIDTSPAELFCWEEGLCVQAMHVGPYNDEPATIARMGDFLTANGYAEDFSQDRFHHEIYLLSPRKIAPEKCKSVIRHTIK